MHLKAPTWWHEKGRRRSNLLSPIGRTFGRIVELRWRRTTPYCSELPVICVGNLTLGGAGKTPTAIALAQHFVEAGEKPIFVTRGYGGKFQGPHLVDRRHDLPHDVGDEPLLLASYAPTIVAKNRAKGVQLAENMQAATMVIMDDGFQNPTVKKDFSLVVVDGEVGVGNGQIFPAGPLRASLEFQLGQADAILALGTAQDNDTALTLLGLASKKPFFRGMFVPAGKTEKFNNKKLIAYCGIGRPEKFFQTLEKIGAKIVETHEFPDHHNYSQRDAIRLLERSEELKCPLVTTEKDFARLTRTDGALQKLLNKSKTLSIELSLHEEDQDRLLAAINEEILARRNKS